MTKAVLIKIQSFHLKGIINNCLTYIVSKNHEKNHEDKLCVIIWEKTCFQLVIGVVKKKQIKKGVIIKFEHRKNAGYIF
jgi:hypothetical protein